MRKQPPKPKLIATISKEFTFDAAHFLPTVPEGHKCRRMHGHTYRVELVLRDQVADNGFVGGWDYGDIARFWNGRVQDVIDHRVLNEIPGLEVPSTENLAAWIFREIANAFGKALDRVRIQESSTTWCEVTRLEMECAGLLDDLVRRPQDVPNAREKHDAAFAIPPTRAEFDRQTQASWDARPGARKGKS